MAVGGALGWRNFLELVREWCFLESGVPVKQLISQRKGMGVEREQDGVGEARREGQCGELNLI
jgi:hypothetical protein